MAFDIFHNYNFSTVDDAKSLNESYNDEVEYSLEDEIDRPYGIDQDWEFVKSKSVTDFNGFVSEYSWWHNPKTNEHMFFFDGVEDWTAESEREAEEWFSSYNGFEDDDDTSDEWMEYDNTWLNESYNNFPEWLIKWLDSHKYVKRELTNRGIDLHNATFVEAPIPQSAREANMIRKTRLPIFTLGQGPYTTIYIPGVNDPDIKFRNKSGDIVYENASRVAVRDILDLTVAYGYIDLTDSRNKNTELATARRNLAYEMKPYTRGEGQHAVKVNKKYGVDSRGRTDYNNLTSYDIEWVTQRGQDKSGYPLDPSKYMRMLDDVGLDTYADRLESYYGQIERLRAEILELVNKYDIEYSLKNKVKDSWAFSTGVFDAIADSMRLMSKAIDYYQRIKEEVERTIKRYGDSDEVDINKEIQSVFKWAAPSLRDNLKDAKDSLKRARNTVSTSTTED